MGIASVLFDGTETTPRRVPSTVESVTREIVPGVAESAGGLLFDGITPSRAGAPTVASNGSAWSNV